MRRLRQLLLITTLLSGCDGETPDNRPLGPSDPAAMLSCMAPAAAPLTAASTPEAASSAVIELPHEALAPGNAYRVTLPEEGAGYAVIRVHEMHNDVALFVSERDRITNLEPDGITSGLRHAVCPDTLIDDNRVHVHEPTDYRITFAATGPREFTLVAILAQVGHPPDDGGVHAHDGGHDEDGGVHAHDGGHDEDAGVDADGGDHDHDGGP